MNDLKSKIDALPDDARLFHDKHNLGLLAVFELCTMGEFKQLIADYERRIAELREALEHYSDEVNWEKDYPNGEHWKDLYSPQNHGYAIAKAALEADGGGE